jgi:hypothetical protein
MAENGFYASAVFNEMQMRGARPGICFFSEGRKKAVGIRRSVVGYADSIPKTTDS